MLIFLVQKLDFFYLALIQLQWYKLLITNKNVRELATLLARVNLCFISSVNTKNVIFILLVISCVKVGDNGIKKNVRWCHFEVVKISKMSTFHLISLYISFSFFRRKEKMLVPNKNWWDKAAVRFKPWTSRSPASYTDR